MNLAKLKMVEVTWDDASSYSYWQDADDFTDNSAGFLVRTVGFLVEKTDKYIKLVGDVCDEQGKVHHGHVIPRGMVRRIRHLEYRGKQ